VGFVTRATGDPLPALEDWLQGEDPGELLLVNFDLHCWWQEPTVKQSLVAIYYRDDRGLFCAVTDKALRVEAASASDQVNEWAASHQLAFFMPGQPMRLAPVNVAKPWGREVWFTGVEARGLSCFHDDHGQAPIPWVQAIMPGALAGAPERPLILLKILDPVPEEVRGDLYFELHEEKREVYVVTHVDEKAWPNGTGGIRFGFDPVKLGQATDESSFRQDYLAAVQDYESVRRRIDALPEGVRPEPELLSREVALRTKMNEFTYLRDLRVGDVVVVPLLMPHSLQHGVRTIEFQTPVYERQILSFAQQVLTQDHWDTAAAVDMMRLQPPPEQPFAKLQADDGVAIERIVDFPDFEVRRIRIEPGRSYPLRLDHCYGLVMVVKGELTMTGLNLQAEQAAFLPVGSAVDIGPARPDSALVLLLAMPRG
jgi:hypothetical protein